MEYLRLENINKAYGTKVLLDDVDVTLSQGDKVALIAKNGSGKTTLLKIIAGIEAPEGDDYTMVLNQYARMGFLTQDPQFDQDWTIRDALISADDDRISAYRDYYHTQMGDTDIPLESVNQRMDNLNAWDLEAQIHQLAHELSLGDLDQKIANLSGGQVKRVALAKIILEDYDFLILDEPTNHLDLQMIEWLEEYLKKPALTLFMVTHDRYFLENVCNYMLELDRGAVQKFKGSYGDYLIKKATMKETQAANLDKNKKLLKRELEWMRKQPKARGTKAKSRIQDYHDLSEDVQNSQIQDDEMQFYLPGRRLGKKIVEFRTVSFSYGDKKILNNFEYKFKPKEKVGIVGPNGAGKTTFIKLLLGELKPTAGRVEHGETVHFGHYQQEGISIDSSKKVIDVIQDIAEYLPLDNGKEISAAQLLERFMFPRPQQQVYANQLSGGELKRLQLLAVLMANPNFLILDEPTNDLDILTLNVLEGFLKEFPGCLIIISHDRYFLDKLVDHLFVLDGKGNVKDFNGGYTAFRNKYGKGFDIVESKSTPSKSEDQKKSRASSSKNDYELQKELKKVEREIEKLEQQKARLHQKMISPDLTQEDMIRLAKELKEMESKIEDSEARWMSLSESLEA